MTKQNLAQLMEEMMGPRRGAEGVWRHHNCWRCQDGKKPCVVGEPRECEHLHERND